jgi:hypothetical protein
MLAAAQTILNAAADAFPSLNLKLPIQSEGTMLDGTNATTGTDVALATLVLSWAYGAFPGRFFAQLNFASATSPPDCVSPCRLDMPQSPDSVFNLIRQYQPQGVGLQDVDAAVDGGVNNCSQNGGVMPCTPMPCGSLNPVQYAAVSLNTWNVVRTYTPRFWEISKDDATTMTGSANSCQITSDEQALMREVFSTATTQMEKSRLTLDVDGDGIAKPLTDGILIVRYLYGLSGPVLTANALGSGATRTDPNAIIAYLDKMKAAGLLDVDANGQDSALSDGVLITRYLFGLSGPALTASALGSGATRTDPSAIAAFLSNLMP